MGSSEIPSLVGRTVIEYSKDKKPGTSIVTQANFPGRLSLLLPDVFPIWYHDWPNLIHWNGVTYFPYN